MADLRLGEYRILEKLGEGLMGETFLAEASLSGQKVAVKILARPIRRNPSARALFVRQAKAAASLEHPFICKIHEVRDELGRTFVVSEYVQGQSLKARMAQGTMMLSEALQATRQICEALTYAHRKGVVHQDLKPSNISLMTEGLKVMDFGLIKGIPTLEYLQGGARESIAISSMAYMSPEQLRVHHLDARSDVFSLGVVLHEMVTGANPFQKGSFLETVDSVLNVDPPPLSNPAGEFPELLRELVAKALAKDLEQRYASIEQMQADLESLVACQL